MTNLAEKITTHPLENKQFLNCFMKVVKEVFQVQVGTTVKNISVLGVGESPFSKGDYAIGAVLPLKMKKRVGSIALCFPEASYLQAYSSILGEEHKSIDDDNQDGASELLNMIYGGAKTVLNEVGFKFEMALPCLLLGEAITEHEWHDGVQANFLLECGIGQVFFGIQWDLES